MTTDASPVNHYLLWSQSDEFSTDAKIDYALRHHHIFDPKGNGLTSMPTSLSTELERRMLVRTSEELKRGICLGDRVPPLTPGTATTFKTNVSGFSSTECTTLPYLETCNDGDTSNFLFDGACDLDAKPWDAVDSSQVNYWSCPMEVLYQSYHLWIALDYGRDVFSVTRNGMVLADRIPTIVSSLLQVIETTLHAREQDFQQLRAFVEGAIADEQTRSRVLQQVWNPTVCVSVVLLNVPREVKKTVPFSRPAYSDAEATCKSAYHSRQRQHPTIIMYPPESLRFTTLETDGSEPFRCSTVTLLSRCDAREVLSDDRFMDRLRDLLGRYESVYREKSVPLEWPQSSLSASLEYLMHAMPESTPECNTLIFVSNVSTMTSSDSLAFLESTVRRKNLIVSIVALNRMLTLDSPELSPLSRFLSSVGGFAVHVDYWLALAAHRLNKEWCHKFAGSRCLAQQIFVNLVNRFPMTIPGATRRDLLADTIGDPIVLYDGDRGLPDFVIGAPMKDLLRATAALRFNQGWSVLMDYRDESSTSHMAARYEHEFHRGTITLHYEMNINRPAVYRRLLVSGTKVLADHFCKARWDEEAATVVGEGGGHWLTYLSLLRLRLDLWMKAEQALMQVVNAGPRQMPMSAIPGLVHLSSAEGVLTQWFNAAAVTSIGVFFSFEELSPAALVSYTRGHGANGTSTETAARACIRAAMDRRHRLVGHEEDLTYLHTETVVATLSSTRVPGAGRDVFSLVQFFPLYETSTSTDFGLAGVFECRVSCVLCDHATQKTLICALLSDIEEAVRMRNRATVRRDRHLLVQTSFRAQDDPTLQLVKATLGIRPPGLITSCTEGSLHVDASSNGTMRVSSTLSVPPKGKAKRPPGLEDCFRCPLVSFPWSLLNALCFHWILGCSDYHPFLSEEIFSHVVSRRLHAGFTLIVYYTSSLKAVLAKHVSDASANADVCIFDVLQAIPSAAPAAQISVHRLVTPFKRARSPQWTYTRDIEEDLHIATAVFTCKAIATRQPWSRCLLAQEMRERGFSPIVARVESILFALQVRCTEYVELRSPPSLGVKGCVELRDRLLNIVSCMGDHSAVVKARMLQDDYVQRLSSGSSMVGPNTDVCISVLSPISFKTILCILILESDTEVGAAQNTIKVALAALDEELLEYAIAQRYHRSRSTLSVRNTVPGTEGEEAASLSPPRSAMPECAADRAIVLSLRYMLTVFTSVFCARGLISFIMGASEEATVTSAVQELTDAHAHLSTYAVEIDVTHLQRLEQWRCCEAASGSLWKNKMQEVLTDVLASHQRSFSAHPTLWLPKSTSDHALCRGETVCRDTSSPSEEEMYEGSIQHVAESHGARGKRPTQAGGDGASEGRHTGVDIFPVALKACVFLPSSATGFDSEKPAVCRWISSEPGRCDDLRCKILRDSSEWTIPAAFLKDTDTFYSPAEEVGTTSDHSKLRIFVRTVPTDLLGLCEVHSFRPTQTAVRRTLRLLYYRFSSEKASSALSGLPTLLGSSFMVEPTHQATGDRTAAAAVHQLFAQPLAMPWDRQRCDDAFLSCTDRGSLPIRVERVMQEIAEGLKWRVAVHCLQTAFSCASFRQLKACVDGGISALAVPQGTTAAGASTMSMQRQDDMTRETQPRDVVLAHGEKMTGMEPGGSVDLHALLCGIVTPAILSSNRFVCDTFPVEFTRQETNIGQVVPEEAIRDVFRRCVEDDWMWVRPTHPLSYVVIPNRDYFGDRWVLVCATTTPSHALNDARIMFYDAEDTDPALDKMRKYCSHLKEHLSSKIKQVNQLHLLKQLRESFNASAELIPPGWGDQFSQSGSASTCGQKAGPMVNSQDAYANGSPFYLRGRNVLEIPIYYKLQHQCKKILHRIQCHCSRLELVAIFNRDQCFLAADDVEGDTFHYLRLVFVKDTTHTVSLTSRSPPLTSSSRCPKLVVQLFSATANASVQRPLQRLQDFCYLLAVQELQGHLNYVQHKMISFNDLVFLQNQRLEPIMVNLRTILDSYLSEECDDASCYSSQAIDTYGVQLQNIAIALLFLNLREYKFKPFGIQDEPTHATSNFVEHYNLEKSLSVEAAMDSAPTQDGGHSALRAWRFVKIVDGVTDVLVSCCLNVHPDKAHTIVLDRYLTRIPAERYINGDSENTILAQLGHSVEKTIAQLRFFGLTSPGQSSFPFPRSSVRTTVNNLLHISQEADSQDSSLLRYQHFSLDNVNPAVLPMLADRICGALAHYDPTCFTYSAGRAARGIVHVPSFSWSWMESLQSDALLDTLDIFVTCGYDVRDSPESTSPLAPTRVVPYVVPGVPITTVTTGGSQMSLLGEYGLCEHGCPLLEYRIALSISLTEGLSLALFNLRDTEYIVRLLDYVVLAMEEKSALLEDVLLQRMGFSVPSFFNEADLARNCCGDDTNIIRSKSLSISTDAYRRRVNNIRFRPHPDPDLDEPLVVILEGLYNRGLIVNYIFCAEDAIKVLFDECPQYTLQECVRIVDALLEARVLCDAPHSALKPQMSFMTSLPHSEQLRSDVRNCRLSEVGGVPADALIACSYRRHILASHIIVEAQNARSGVAEVLAKCDMLWRAGPQHNVLELAKAVVTLQLKSKEVFGARVPDFSLRRERWRHEDDVLDPTLPTQTQQNVSYARPVDASMHLYTEHLRQLYPSMCFIDLDPNDPLTTSDEVLLNRLRCRYGKVTSEDGSVVLFSPHLYYAIIPFVDLLRCSSFYERYSSIADALAEGADVSPITTSGLFIVEVGFQVVHYALDFFVINGDAVPPGITAKVAAEFKQTLHFESVLYDAAVRTLAHCVRTHSIALSGQQKTHMAVTTLVKYHPFPPMHCGNIVAAYTITDPQVMRLKGLTPTSSVTSGDLYVSTDGVLYLSSQKQKMLQREGTNELYNYGGVIIWERAQLFVLLTNTQDVRRVIRESNSDLSRIALRAKNLLLNQLLESTQQERLDVARRKFLTDGHAAAVTVGRGNAERELPTYDEFELLRSHSHKVVLHSYVPVLQMILEPVEWSGDGAFLQTVCAQLYPEHVLRVIRRQRSAREAQETSASTPHARLYDIHTVTSAGASAPRHAPAGAADSIGGYDITRLFMSPCLTGWFVVTFAPRKTDERDSFLAMECFSDPHRPFGASVVVEELNLYCKPSRGRHQHRVMTFLSEAEQLLVERFIRLVNSAVWYSIVPCFSQFVA